MRRHAQVRGLGAVFKNVDAYGDVIEPGAFAAWLSDVKSGKQDWPAMLSQHGGWGMTSEDLTPVGAWLDLSEDGNGLRVEGELADTQRGLDLYTLMKMKPRPAIKGCRSATSRRNSRWARSPPSRAGA
jgi:HK97 family phage prohead protease